MNKVEHNWNPAPEPTGLKEVFGFVQARNNRSSVGDQYLVLVNPYGVFYIQKDGKVTYSSYEYFQENYEITAVFPNAKMSVEI